MNSRKSKIILLGLLSVVPAFAITPGVSAGATLAVTVTYEEGGFKDLETGEPTDTKYTEKLNGDGDTVSETYDYKSVIKTARYGNKELLEYLLEEGSLDDTSISGWSLVSVQSGDSEDAALSLFAVKKGKMPVFVETSTEIVAAASAYTGKETYDYVKDTGSYSESGSDKVVMEFGILDVYLRGVATGTYKWANGVMGKGDDAVEYGFTVSGAIKFNGSGTDMDSNVVEGSVSLAAGKIVDLESMGF